MLTLPSTYIPISSVFSFVVVIACEFQWLLKIRKLYFLITLCHRLWVSPVETDCGSPSEPRVKEQPFYEVCQSLDKVLKQERLAQIQIAAASFCSDVMNNISHLLTFYRPKHITRVTPKLIT